MTTQRKIIHIDMDCFFAAVEMRDNPSLHDKPVAVGGSAKRRGVIATCNYRARAFGVRSAMATAHAFQRCPELVLVPGRMSVYQQVSRQIHQVFRRYTQLIEPLSLDEAFLDVSDCRQCRGSATLIAGQIRQEIFNQTGLTASAGVAPNKFIAKIASDENKPDGQCVITPAEVDAFSAGLSLAKIPGVGKATFARLQALGLYTGSDVRHYPRAELLHRFGKFGPVLLDRCYGIDERPVEPYRQRKSVGVEHTFAIDIDGILSCQEAMEGLYPELERRLGRVEQGLAISKQVVKIKFADFQSTTAEKVSQSLDPALFLALLQQAMSRSEGRSVRLLGISVGLHKPSRCAAASAEQLSLLP